MSVWYKRINRYMAVYFGAVLLLLAASSVLRLYLNQNGELRNQMAELNNQHIQLQRHVKTHTNYPEIGVWAKENGMQLISENTNSLPLIFRPSAFTLPTSGALEVKWVWK